MKKLTERALVYKTSRISYISNYLIMILAIVLFFLLLPDLKFTLFPKTLNEFIPTMAILLLLMVISLLFEQPTLERWKRHYVITNNEIIKEEGILRKVRSTIPFQSVADLKVEKGIMGRILNFGTIQVTGYGQNNVIVMRGMRHPDELYNIIRNKINLMRKTVIKRKSM
jgi:membrane protein YdbS with pleckstrin-like domain